MEIIKNGRRKSELWNAEELIQLNEQMKKITSSPMLAACAAPIGAKSEAKNARRTAMNLAILMTGQGIDQVGAYKVFDSVDWEFVYQWDESYSLESYFLKMFGKAMKQRENGNKNLPMFYWEGLVKNTIPSNLMKMPSMDQKVKPVELAYVLALITRKIEKMLREDGAGNNYCVLARNYFAHPEVKKDYKKRTKRTPNNHKLGLIFRLLEEYQFVQVVRRLDQRKPNVFRAGAKHPRWNRYQKKQQPAVAEEV